MNQAENLDQGLGMMASLQQVVKALGFHDMASFLMVVMFLVISAAFVISFALVLVKKRRERRDELHKIVTEVQKPFLESKAPEQVVVEAKHVEELVPTKTPEPEPQKIVEQEYKPSPKVEPVVAPQRPPKEVKPDEGKILGLALKNTRGGFMEKLSRLFSKKASISDADFEEIEAILFTADIGTKTAQKLLDVLRERVKVLGLTDKNFFFSVLKEEIIRILSSANQIQNLPHDGPRVVMFVGVNGAGKTTSIGKLGARLAGEGKKVVFGAGDTFRAAAGTQLAIWGSRVGAEVVSGKENADSASVLFETIVKAKETHADYALCDTAGRLHTKTSLMDELKKVHRVVAKAMPGAPHEVFLVIDATMGQNAIAQAREFAQSTPLTGIILSKLDGTAKGGVAIGMVDELKVPIRYIGIGEQVGDFKDFDAKQFVDALFMEI